LKKSKLTATGIFFVSSTESGDQGEFAAPCRLTDVQGLGANPVGVSGPAIAVAAEAAAGLCLDPNTIRILVSAASEMTFVTSREKNSSML
jgi:hypothetical protein